MATMITDECINCGACEPECPNTAIYQGGIEFDATDGSKQAALSDDFFYIVPEKCTECVGFFDQEACAAVCPVDCCIPNPDIPEAEDVLFARAKELHPGESFPDDFPSRFKEGAGGGDAGGGDAAAPAAGAAAPAGGAAPAAAVVAAGAQPVAHFGKVEKKVELEQPAARNSPFTGELDLSFDDALAVVSPGAGEGVPSQASRIGVMLAQPILGALPAAYKKRIEDAMQDQAVFSAGGATGFNVLLHCLVLPLAFVGIAVLGGANFYSEDIRWWFFYGAAAAAIEGIIRLRESVIQARPLNEVVYRGSIYGPLLIPLVAPAVALAERSRTQGDVAFEGYYDAGSAAYDEKRERERRYGEIYSLDERPNGYLFRLELPRTIPPSGVKDELGLGDEMPDYALDMSLSGGAFSVHGKVVDSRLRTVAATAPAFPADFTTRVPLDDRCAGFVHRYRDKVLEVVLVKLSVADRLPAAADAA